MVQIGCKKERAAMTKKEKAGGMAEAMRALAWVTRESSAASAFAAEAAGTAAETADTDEAKWGVAAMLAVAKKAAEAAVAAAEAAETAAAALLGSGAHGGKTVGFMTAPAAA
jgi:hypothetical protein